MPRDEVHARNRDASEQCKGWVCSPPRPPRAQADALEGRWGGVLGSRRVRSRPGVARLGSVKRLALSFAIFWWAQGPLCLLPVDHAHASASSGAAAQHHHAAPATPESSHHPGPGTDDSGCAEHCTSLGRALSPAAPQANAPASPWLPLPEASPRLGEIPSLASPSEVARERPPPDLLLRNATLRI